MSSSAHRSRRTPRREITYFLWNYFWKRPEEKCPKCGSYINEYYDPFFFNPMRTLRGRRRIKCLSCNFIWRPQRKRFFHWKNLLSRF